VLEKIIDKLSWIIAYMLLPITYPIHRIKMNALNKKIEKETELRENALKRSVYR
jgi:hypothetical protein